MWIVNENLFIAPLRPILQDIRLFAMLSKEVIIVNFVDFPIGTYFLKKTFFAGASLFIIKRTTHLHNTTN